MTPDLLTWGHFFRSESFCAVCLVKAVDIGPYGGLEVPLTSLTYRFGGANPKRSASLTVDLPLVPSMNPMLDFGPDP